MNLPEGWLEATGTSPLVLAFLILIGASLLVFFLAPFFFKLVKKAKFPARFGFIKRHPKRSLAAVFVILIAIFGAYVYYYFSQPVHIVSAAQLKLEKGKQIRVLQQKGLNGWQEASLYLLDIRSQEEYAKEHLKGSVSKPLEKAAVDTLPLEKGSLVIYSTGSRFEEARETAEVVIQNAKVAKKSRRKVKFGKVYVIRDGFEGLKKNGLVTETGVWD